jgi:hypothetical protein
MQAHQSDARIEGSSMSDVLPRSGDTITPRESADLMRLFAELSDLASRARDVLRSAPQALALQRLREADARIQEKIDSITAIVR